MESLGIWPQMSLIRFFKNLNSGSHWTQRLCSNTSSVKGLYPLLTDMICLYAREWACVDIQVVFKCVLLLLLADHLICSLRFSQLVRNIWFSEILSIFSWKCSLPINYWINGNLTMILKATLCRGSFICISTWSASSLLASIRIKSLPHRSADFYIYLSWEH